MRVVHGHDGTLLHLRCRRAMGYKAIPVDFQDLAAQAVCCVASDVEEVVVQNPLTNHKQSVWACHFPIFLPHECLGVHHWSNAHP